MRGRLDADVPRGATELRFALPVSTSGCAQRRNSHRAQLRCADMCPGELLCTVLYLSCALYITR